MIEDSQFLQKLDLSEPGLFVFHSSRVLPAETIQRVTEKMDSLIQQYSPESRSLFLDGSFSPTVISKEVKPTDSRSIVVTFVGSIIFGFGLGAIITKIVLSF